MNADVNVTEKVARAEAERRWPHEYVAAASWRDGFVAGAAWHRARGADFTLADPEVQAGIAGVLREHEGQGETCWGCGASREPSPGAPWAGWHAAHQAAEVVEWLRGRAL